MRCRALAQAWCESGGQVVFVLRERNPAMDVLLLRESCMLEYISAPAASAADAMQTIAMCGKYQAAWVVVDGYQFGVEYRRLLKEACLRVLWLDDCCSDKNFYADLVLDQSPFHDESLCIKKEPFMMLLRGSRYVLLRKEFLCWRQSMRDVAPTAKRVLVALGGSDPENITLKVVRALLAIKDRDLEIVVIMGMEYSGASALRSLLKNVQHHTICLKRNVDNMPEQMAWADIAVVAGGTTSWELAFMGVPSVMIVLSDNQVNIANSLDKKGVTINLGWHFDSSIERIADMVKSLIDDEARRRSMIECGRQMVDGNGVYRVLTCMRAFQLNLRHAGIDDCRLLWEWVNEPSVRASAFSSETIPWDGHVKWLQNKLSSAQCIIYIGSDRVGLPVGQVRFDWDERGDAEIDVSIDKKMRGSGLGAALIRRAVNEIIKISNVKCVRASIKQDNTASVSAFANAGFHYEGLTTMIGHPAVHYSLPLACG